MQVLAAGGVPVLTDGVRAADEDNPRGYIELEAVKRTAADPSWVAAAVGRAVKVVYALVPALPAGFEYRVILVRRRLDEVVASQERMLARRRGAVPSGEAPLGGSGTGAPPADLSPAAWAERLGRDLARVTAWLAGRPGFRVLEVSHRELVTAPEPVAAAIDRFLGGGLDTAAMARAVDPALYRIRR